MEAQKKILLVEDDQGLASVYVTRLEAEGFSVLHVPNGEDALSKTLEFKPDLIILDVMMPKISGFDVLDILRNTPETANVRIIMLTALSQESDMEKAKGLGVDDYLVKSQVVIADVVERIKYHLGMGGTPPPPQVAVSDDVDEEAEQPVAAEEAAEEQDEEVTEEPVAETEPAPEAQVEEEEAVEMPVASAAEAEVAPAVEAPAPVAAPAPEVEMPAMDVDPDEALSGDEGDEKPAA